MGDRRGISILSQVGGRSEEEYRCVCVCVRERMGCGGVGLAPGCYFY